MLGRGRKNIYIFSLSDWITLNSVSHCRNKKTKEWRGLVDEEDPGAGQGGESVRHLADSGIVDESSEEEQEAWRGEERGMRLVQ